MEETANTTELVYAAIAAISASLIGGVISWKLISNKEEQRAKECAMTGEVKWNSRMKWHQKAMLGIFFIFLFSYPFLRIPMTASPKADPMIINLMLGALLLLIIGAMWYMVSIYPLFAITNDSIVLWKYCGYARAEKHLLSELTRKEYDEAARGGNNHIVALYRGGKRFKKLYSNIYKDEKALLELLSQIPEKKES